MRLRLLLPAVAALAAVSFTACSSGGTDSDTADGSVDSSGAVVVTDSQGNTSTFDAPPERLVVINSYNVELVTALGGFDRIVGADQGSIDRVAYKDFDGVSAVGKDLRTLDYEAIVAAEPDAVLIPETVWEDAASQLKAFDIPVVVVTGWQSDQWSANLDLIGTLLGAQDRAAQARTFTDKVRGLVKDRVSAVTPISGYWEYDDFVTAGPDSAIAPLLAEAGITSISTEGTGSGTYEIDPATVLTANPQLVSREVAEEFESVDPATFRDIATAIEARPGWSNLAAVKSGNVVLFNSWPLHIAGWSFTPLYYGSWAHPEAFADIEIASYVQDYTSEFLGIDYPGDDAYIYHVSDHR